MVFYMNTINLGYACINTELNNLKGDKRITTNRGMIKRTFDQRGTKYASELALQNVKDLYRIIKWNDKNNIRFFRISSGVFPWASHYALTDLPDYKEILKWCQKSGSFAKEYGHRLTSHPGPFNKLTSSKEGVIENTIRDLEIHGELFDMLDLPQTPYAKINIHVGASYGDKQMATDNFCYNFQKLSDSVKTRLTVENDDKASLYSTKELYDMIYKRIGVPIVHDQHHHDFCTGGLSQKEAMTLAASTWGDVKPVIHYSQSRSIEYNDSKIKANAHSDSYWEPVDIYGLNVDVMLECKHKEVGLRAMRKLLS